MRKLYLVLLLLAVISLSAQDKSIGEYFVSNDGKSIICIKNDTIGIRLFNTDCFNTSAGYYGRYTTKDEKLLCNKNLLESNTSTLLTSKNPNRSIGFLLEEKDGSPLLFSQLKLTNSRKKKDSVMITYDGNEYPLSDAEIEKLSDSSIVLSVISLMFNTKKSIKLKEGTLYTIRSRVSKTLPLAIMKKDIFLTLVNENEIKIKYSNNIFHFFKKGKCKNILNTLLND